MVSEMMVDRVIGTKSCLKCGYPVSVESYSIPEAKERLEKHINCSNRFHVDGAPLNEYQVCGEMNFTDPKFEVKMKQSRPWVKEALKRMR